jgi:DNA-binding NtrC family response regulator
VIKERILVIEDEHLQRWAVRENLASWGYEVLEASTAEAGIDTYIEQLPDLVLLDLKLPDRSGVEVLRAIKAFDASAVLVMVTAHGGLGEAVEAFRLGLFDFLSKPLDFDALRVALRFGLEARRLRGEVQRWRDSDRQSDGSVIVGDSPAIAESVSLMRRAAASATSIILLQGESGTGKDLFAKAIHYNSPLAKGPFVAVNCSALPDTLLESELFGHEKGAFTDARGTKKGLFELADGGTLYLDEVGELKLGLQAKLLRVIESFTFRRVGGVRDIKVDVRVIAASNRDLETAVEQGAFRADLFYRLSVIQLRLPPLRERPQDISNLTEHFVRDFSVKLRKPVAGVTAEAMELLKRYRWPGNVRELRNAIERAVLLEEGDRITPRYLPVPRGAADADAGSSAAANIVLPPEGLSLEKVQEELVRQAMAHASGNQTRAARLLDISRDALRYKLKKYGIGGGDDDLGEAPAPGNPS